MNKHVVLFVPGLGDTTWGISLLKYVTSHWHRSGLVPLIYRIGWHDQEELPHKLQRITRMITEMKKEKNTISLVGLSAGGSFVLNAFIENRKDVHRVINVCGRLRKGQEDGFRSFESKTRSSSSFAQSIRLFENREHSLTLRDKRKILTIHSKFGDELVPPETTVIKGVRSVEVLMIEHILSIYSMLTIFSVPIIRFIKED